MNKLIVLLLSYSILLIPHTAACQSKDEQLKKVRDEIKQQQRDIEFIQEQHETLKKKQIDELTQQQKLQQEELVKSKQEIDKSKEEISRSKEAVSKSQEALAKKSVEAKLTEQELAKSQQEMLLANEALQHQEDSIRLLMQQKSLQELELRNEKLATEQQTQKSQLLLALLALGGVVLLGVIMLYIINRRKNKELAEKNIVIEEEKKRSEELLLNILPQDVVDEIKLQGKTNPKSYQLATVLFADIKDFTLISEGLSAEVLVASLDAYFEAFDKIIDRSKVEKIKTIGDAYVCVGGVPIANENNPAEVVRIGLQFQEAVLRLKQEREKTGEQSFDVRIGIHTGPVVAGVVGIRKFAYDIWGDTVNTAARMQQFGEPYQINISSGTYEIVKDQFACSYRGKVEVKGKGEIDMYFVDREL